MILSVRTIQKALTQLGYFTGRIDGVYGDITGSAMLRWKETFAARFGARPTTDTLEGNREIDIQPAGAAGELQRAATSYGSAAGTGLVAVLAIGAGVWWVSRKARRGLRGFRPRRHRP